MHFSGYKGWRAKVLLTHPGITRQTLFSLERPREAIPDYRHGNLAKPAVAPSVIV